MVDLEDWKALMIGVFKVLLTFRGMIGWVMFRLVLWYLVKVGEWIHKVENFYQLKCLDHVSRIPNRSLRQRVMVSSVEVVRKLEAATSWCGTITWSPWLLIWGMLVDTDYLVTEFGWHDSELLTVMHVYSLFIILSIFNSMIPSQIPFYSALQNSILSVQSSLLWLQLPYIYLFSNFSRYINLVVPI